MLQNHPASKQTHRPVFNRTFFLFLTAAALWYTLASWWLPITQDEAYYASWVKNLSWGYFDHPPGVAFLGFLSQTISGSWLQNRTATAVASVITLFAIGRLYQLCGLHGKNWLAAMLILTTSLAGLTIGVLTTPDTLQTTAWALGLHEAAHALLFNRKRWLTAGLATGLGLLSKYTMVLIGPVYLISLIATDPKALRTIWPYAGGLVCLLCFLPHLHWNQQHDWTTMRFQANHGFSQEQGAFLQGKIPPPLAANPESKEARLAKPFLDQIKKKEQPKIKKDKSWLRKSTERVNEYLAGQLSFWGLHAFLLLAALWSWLKRRNAPPNPLNPLLGAATFFPLLFFLVIAIFGKVEANWSGMYILSLPPLALAFIPKGRALPLLGLGNTILLGLVLWHSQHPFLPTKPHTDRILKETHGYQTLASWLKSIDKPIFGESYQHVAMLRWYGLEHTVQWPGVTRPSHYAFDSREQERAFKIYEQAQEFILVTNQVIPPTLEGFEPISLERWSDCIDETVIQDAQRISIPLSCQPVHTWYLVEYQKKNH